MLLNREVDMLWSKKERQRAKEGKEWRFQATAGSRTEGQTDRRTNGQKDNRIERQPDRRTNGQKNKRTGEQTDRRTVLLITWASCRSSFYMPGLIISKLFSAH